MRTASDSTRDEQLVRGDDLVDDPSARLLRRDQLARREQPQRDAGAAISAAMRAAAPHGGE